MKYSYIKQNGEEGFIDLPKPPSARFRNVISLDGIRFLLVATPYKGQLVRDRESGSIEERILDYDERYIDVPAMYEVVRPRAQAQDAIDCSYVNLASKVVIVHSTSSDKFERLKVAAKNRQNDRALALISLPTGLKKMIRDEPWLSQADKYSEVYDIVFKIRRSGIALLTEYGSNVKGVRVSQICFQIELQGQGFSNAEVRLRSRLLDYLPTGDSVLRISEAGRFEFSSQTMEGTVFVNGQLVKP